MSGWLDLVTIGGHLGRIADALERAYPPLPEGEKDGSSVFYTDDEVYVRRESERLDYAARTGVVLSELEDVPKSTKEDGSAWR